MKRLFGNLWGIKASFKKRLLNLYGRKIPPEYIITPDLLREVTRITRETKRQIGLIIDRRGRVVRVIVGDRQRILIPELGEYRASPGRLKGVRCVHTHLGEEPLTGDDITDLTLLRLDLIAAVTLTPEGGPKLIHAAHILPGERTDKPYLMLGPLRPDQLDIGCHDMIMAIEDELSLKSALSVPETGTERAVLVKVATGSRRQAEESMMELVELARTAGIHVVDRSIQIRDRVDARFLMGAGKLKDIAVSAMQQGAGMLIFDQELNPSQIRSITDMVSLKVIDRTQLILDIFAQRAKTRDGRIKVELAQLNYLLPRLVTKNTAMSRLTGGIGGRGPGETKLEIHRRRARERIRKLEKELEKVRGSRRQQKALVDRKMLPVISIVGYTNAGKSTLINSLTNSRVFAENRLFATLDPTSRRLRFPRDVEVIITDTVGFIRDLPEDLMDAFKATLEELERADLLLHVIDISHPGYKKQAESVLDLLDRLGLGSIPVIPVLNKMDRVDKVFVQRVADSMGGVAISALDKKSLMPLIHRMEQVLFRGKRLGKDV